ncbi:MAG TPA: DUF4402 domain-containing protein [Saprospiraceae bacterium]|nr:DUF4402 domain-containing protein [Saprospiraceae bacterium]
MQKAFFVFAALAVYFGFTSTIIAQTASALASADASAIIVTPIAISKMADLKFGNIASGTVEGIVVMSIDDVRSGEGGVTLISAGNESNAASFAITGTPDATFTIDLPQSIFVYIDGDKMEVNEFVSNLGEASMLNNEGLANLKVGATLNVNASQTPGLYEGLFDVTVAYN